MKVAGIIFSNLHDSNIPELTRMRTMASVPFACRYRLIDFALSNMVNAGISNISVVTHNNYHSLMDHIGSGKDWDLARRSGGIKILPPFITAYANAGQLYSSRLEALKSINYSLSQMTEDHVVLSDCDIICNLDVRAVVRDHIANGADITMVVKHCDNTETLNSRNTFVASKDGVITDIMTVSNAGAGDLNMNFWVVNRRYLQSVVADALAHGYTSFTHDIILRRLQKDVFRVYKYEGYFANISSLQEYYACSMALLKSDIRHFLFDNAQRPVYTKVRNSAPAEYAPQSVVRNSLLADGCIIEGTVENSILFRGCKVGRNTVVKNCILMQDTIVGENAYLNCVISDKNTVIRDYRNLSGHESMPFYIEKGRMV